MSRRLPPRRVTRIHGIDFSGARDAGRRIWIASGRLAGATLHLDDCRPGRDLPGSGRDRDTALPALRAFVAGGSGAVFGMDFAFGVPADLAGQHVWSEFAAGFARRHPDPRHFREACRTAAGGRELKRATDREAKTPFSPYNLRMYRQTWFGIAEVLAPLIADSKARVLPMQDPCGSLPLLVEVCPASSLKRARLYQTYKGRGDACRRARGRILDALVDARALARPPVPIATRILDDRGGDAIDSVLAAVAAARAARDGFRDRPSGRATAVEGWVYVRAI